MTEPAIAVNDVEITCTPPEGILTVSAETVAALDALALTLTSHPHWQYDLLIGRTPTDTIHLTARPRNHQENAA
jgi:hypothetical protein